MVSINLFGGVNGNVKLRAPTSNGQAMKLMAFSRRPRVCNVSYLCRSQVNSDKSCVLCLRALTVMVMMGVPITTSTRSNSIVCVSKKSSLTRISSLSTGIEHVQPALGESQFELSSPMESRPITTRDISIVVHWTFSLSHSSAEPIMKSSRRLRG